MTVHGRPPPVGFTALEPLPSDAFAGRRCLITGGLGFIGSNLALTLAQAGAEVVVVDALYPRHGGDRHNVDGSAATIRVIESDLAAPGALAAAADAEFIFNLAGQVSHVDSMADPTFDLDANTRNHIPLLETLRAENAAARVVFTSTRQLFGRPHYLPVDEDHPVAPVDVNGITKYASEQLHLLYGETYGLTATIVRLTNVYGPRQRLRDDFQGFLPIFVRRALRGEPILVFGDGAQQRDCLYVDDVVDCLLRAAVAPESPGQVFNVGNDEHLALCDVARMIVDAAGSGSVEFVPWPPDRDAIDIGSYFGDSSKAKRLLGWVPETEFADGIRRTVAFYRRHGEWYR